MSYLFVSCASHHGHVRLICVPESSLASFVPILLGAVLHACISAQLFAEQEGLQVDCALMKCAFVQQREVWDKQISHHNHFIPRRKPCLEVARRKEGKNKEILFCPFAYFLTSLIQREDRGPRMENAREALFHVGGRNYFYSEKRPA